MQSPLIFVHRGLGVFISTLALGFSVQAATITVNSTNDPAGFNPAITIGGLGAAVTLRDAVNAANNTAGDDDIVFHASLNGATVGMSNGTLSVTSTVSIGAQSGMTVKVSRIVGGRLFFVDGGASLTASNLVLVNSRDNQGGAIYNAGTLLLDRCSLTNNSAAQNGGAIFNTGTAHLKATTIRNCSVDGGDTGGGAVWNQGTFTAADSTFAYNAKFSGSLIRGGGAFVAWFSTISLTNCTIAFNTSQSFGGAAHIVNGSMNLVSCTIAGNSSGLVTFQSTVNALNTISQDGAYSGSGNVAASGLGTFGFNGGPTETFPLLPSSPAVGAGVYDAAVTNDQRGVARINPPDSGAYEAVPRQTLKVSTASDENNGTTDPTTGTGTSLREALTLATSLGGTQQISFASSLTSTGAVTITLTNVLPSITNAVVINGAGANLLTVSGGNAYRVFYVSAGASLSVTGMTIANGRVDNINVVDGSGAGIYCGGTLALTDCSLTNNFAGGTNRGQGGAIYAHGTSLSLLRCTIANNRARAGGHGGGIHVDSGSASIDGSTVIGNQASAHGGGISAWTSGVSIANSSISGNAGVNGGGLYQNSASLFLSACSIYNNTTISNGYGGGVFTESGTGVIERSTFAYNVASNGNGGAIANLGATIAATNSTIAFNNADNGGGIIHYGSPLTLVHCTVMYNSADVTGGGIERVGRVGNTFKLLNTLVGGNNAPTGPDAYSFADINNGTFTTLGNNLIGDSSGMLGLTNGVSSDLVNVPPFTLALQNNGGPTETIAFSPYSAAINGAAAVPDLSIDQRGAARSVGGAPDIGAYEDPTGNGDYDNDSLNNAQEGLAGSSSFAVDTDNDGYNDATEFMAGSGANNPSSRPSKTHISRVLGIGPSRGLDLNGTFAYAFNVGTPGAAGTAGDATFTSDSAAGITVAAGNEIPNWLTREFSGLAEDGVLETVYQSIRWEQDPSPLTVNLANLTTGRTYKLQLMMAEPSDYDRKFDVFVEGALIANDFSPSIAQGIPVRSYAAAAIVHEFIATDSVLNIVLSGTNVVGGTDVNPILQGVTLELLPIPTDPLKFNEISSEAPGEFGIAFTNTPGVSFTVYGSTNLFQPLTLWSNLGPAFSSPPGSGFYYYNYSAPPGVPAYFLRIESP